MEDAFRITIACCSLALQAEKHQAPTPHRAVAIHACSIKEDTFSILISLNQNPLSWFFLSAYTLIAMADPEINSHVCVKCRAMFHDLSTDSRHIQHLICRVKIDGYPSLDALKASSDSGCPICFEFWNQISNEEWYVSRYVTPCQAQHPKRSPSWRLVALQYCSSTVAEIHVFGDVPNLSTNKFIRRP
jgi:hypothetical protein